MQANKLAEHVLQQLAIDILKSVNEKTRSVFAKFEKLRVKMRQDFGVEVYFVGEIVQCRRIAEIRARSIEVDPNAALLFIGTVAEHGLVDYLDLKRADLELKRVGDFVLAGKADAVLPLEEHGVTIPVEVKLSLKYTIPRYNHYLQAALYAFLYDAPFALLIFMGKMFRLIAVPNILTSDQVRKIVDTWKSVCPLLLEECQTCAFGKRGYCSRESRDMDFTKRGELYRIVQNIKNNCLELVLDEDTVRKLWRSSE